MYGFRRHSHQGRSNPQTTWAKLPIPSRHGLLVRNSRRRLILSPRRTLRRRGLNCRAQNFLQSFICLWTSNAFANAGLLFINQRSLTAKGHRHSLLLEIFITFYWLDIMFYPSASRRVNLLHTCFGDNHIWERRTQSLNREGGIGILNHYFIFKPCRAGSKNVGTPFIRIPEFIPRAKSA
jgi:hypothetical protein